MTVQQFGLNPTGMNFAETINKLEESNFTPPFDIKKDGLRYSSQVITHQSMPSPPCSVPDQQQNNLMYNQQMMIGMPSPNTTNGLFDNNSLRIIDNNVNTNTTMNTLEEQQQILNSNIHNCSTEFNGQDAAAAVAAAEQHMQQQQMMVNMMQQQSQQQQQMIQQQPDQMAFIFKQDESAKMNLSGNTTVVAPAITSKIAQNHLVINPKQFDDMSREQLIARLVVLEKEKHSMIDSSNESTISVQSPHSADDNTTEEEVLTNDDEEDNTVITEQQKIRTCLWTDCGQKFDVLQKLISHITEIHVGGGKATYRCEWQKCSRSNKPFTKRHKMYNHLRTHTGERPFACPKPDCEKKFSRPDSLTTHIKTHSNVRPFVCLFKGCGKAYYHSRSLKKHEKIHETALETPLPPPPQPLVQQQPPPSYEQVMATTTATTATATTNNNTGQVPTNTTIGHFVDPNMPFYQQQPQFNNQQQQPPVTFPFPPHITTQFNNNNYIIDPTMNSTPIIQTFMESPSLPNDLQN